MPIEEFAMKATPELLLGMFITRWEAHHGGIEYKPVPSYADEAKAMRQIMREEGELAVYCIEAMFAPGLKWLNTRTLEWLARPDHRIRYVRPVAAGIMKARRNAAPQATSEYDVHIERPTRR